MKNEEVKGDELTDNQYIALRKELTYLKDDMQALKFSIEVLQSVYKATEANTKMLNGLRLIDIADLSGRIEELEENRVLFKLQSVNNRLAKWKDTIKFKIKYGYIGRYISRCFKSTKGSKQ
jgi:hypothetical protein